MEALLPGDGDGDGAWVGSVLLLGGFRREAGLVLPPGPGDAGGHEAGRAWRAGRGGGMGVGPGRQQWSEQRWLGGGVLPATFDCGPSKGGGRLSPGAGH